MGVSVLYKMCADLVSAIEPAIGKGLVFIKNRPSTKADDLPMRHFAVIDLPTSVSDAVIGGCATLLNTSGVVYVYTQGRSDNTLDVNVTGSLIDAVCGVFPIKGKCIVATNPLPQMQGPDRWGFQVTSITFDLRSRWRAFETIKQFKQ